MRYISKAYWPEGCIAGIPGENTTTDKHYSKGEAQAVCDRLESEGFGGEGKIFPIKTEVIEPKE